MDWKVNKHVIIPEGTKLSERMFQYNNIVETITLPNDVTFLPDYFCFGCKNLKAILGGENIKAVGYRVFEDSPKLHHLDFTPQIGHYTTCPRIRQPIQRHSRPINIDFDRPYTPRKASLEIHGELNVHHFGTEGVIDNLQSGYVLHKQNDEYLIWNVTAKKYVYTIIHAPIPLYSYITFLCKYLVIHSTENHLEIERNLVDDVHIASDEDIEKFIYSGDAEAYINSRFSYIKKIKTMETTIVNYIDSLNIEEIIESYTVSIDEHIRTKIGDDDTYTLNESANSNANPSDVYLRKLLPSYSKETEKSGYCTFSYMTDKEKETYKDKEKSVKFEAMRQYSKGEHITSLIDAYIRYLYRRTNIYQEVLEAVNFLNKNRKYIRSFMSWDYYYWDDISQFTFKLNENLNS